MSVTVITKQAASLSANHPLGQILVQMQQPDVSDAASVAAAQASPALLLAGEPELGPGVLDGSTGQGLTAAGVAAVLSSWNTYVAGLTAVKKAQIGCLRCNVTSAGLCLSVHVLDVAAQAASLQTTLNNAANFGAIGS